MTGKKMNIKISIPGNQMFVVFNTNGNTVKKGFYAKILESMLCIYSSVCMFSLQSLIINFYSIVDMCQYWFNESAGTLTSPYFGGNYGHNLNCTWMITIQVGFYINFEIDYFRVY